MKSIALVFVLFMAMTASAVIVEPLTPRSYVLSFVGEGFLPPNAKVVSIGLEVDQAEAVRVRSTPLGWSTVVFPTARAKFGVGLEWLRWGKDQGSPAALAELNDRFWILAMVDDRDKPVPPRIQVSVSYILPPKGESLSMQVPSSSICLTYIP